MKKPAILLLLASCAPCRAQSQKLTLDEAVKTALKQHPSLRRLDSLTQAARARATAAKSGALPFVDFGASATTGPSGSPAMGLRGLAGTPLKSHYGGSVNVTQLLYDFGKVKHGAHRAEALVEASSQRTQTQRAWIVLKTKEAYYNTLLAQRLVVVADATVRVREQTVRQAQAHLDAGLRSRVDLRLAELELTKAQARLSESRNALAAAFADLRYALGEEERRSYELETSPTTPLPTGEGIELSQSIAISLKQRPELHEHSSQLRAARESVEVARSQKRPDLIGVTSLGRVNPPGFLNTSKQRDPYALGLAVSVPLFTGRRIESEVREARANLEAVEAAGAELAQGIRLQVTRAHLNLQTQRVNVRAAEQQVKTAEDALALATTRYQNNLSDIVELTQSQLAHTEALTAQATASFNVKIAEAALRYAIGAET